MKNMTKAQDETIKKLSGGEYKFNQKEIADLIELFVFIDRNNDGVISMSELNQLLKYCNLDVQNHGKCKTLFQGNIQKRISLFDFLYLITGKKLDTYINEDLELTSFIFSYLGDRFSDEEIDEFVN
jgi:Ca2+-binding EF-hand superfamily protein